MFSIVIREYACADFCMLFLFSFCWFRSVRPNFKTMGHCCLRHRGQFCAASLETCSVDSLNSLKTWTIPHWITGFPTIFCKGKCGISKLFSLRYRQGSILGETSTDKFKVRGTWCDILFVDGFCTRPEIVDLNLDLMTFYCCPMAEISIFWWNIPPLPATRLRNWSADVPPKDTSSFDFCWHLRWKIPELVDGIS